ncbi:MAG: hypothetical protein ACRC7C_15690 [Beijerinckiaceae bacterium]
MTSVWLSPELKAIRSGRSPRALTGGGLAGLWSDAPLARMILRRSGLRPLAFNGMLLVAHRNDAAGESLRCHTIRLYETADGVFIVEIALEAEDGSALPHAVVEEVSTLAEAEAFLNAYDPSAQAPLTLDVVEEHGAFPLARTADALSREALRLRDDFETARAAIFAAAGQPMTDQSTTDTLQRAN